jgi:hypothetical protein
VTSQGALRIVFEDLDDDDFPTAVANFDLAAYARAAAVEEEQSADAEWGSGPGGPGSGIRPSLPTLSNEVGPLLNEPEADTILRALGGGDRELRLHVHVADVSQHHLGPQHGYLLGLVDGVTSITEILDISAMPRTATLRAILELVMLGVVG